MADIKQQFYDACTKNDLDLVKQLYQDHPAVLTGDVLGQGMITAVTTGYFLREWLFKLPATNVNVSDPSGCNTAFMKLCLQGDDSGVKWFLTSPRLRPSVMPSESMFFPLELCVRHCPLKTLLFWVASGHRLGDYNVEDDIDHIDQVIHNLQYLNKEEQKRYEHVREIETDPFDVRGYSHLEIKAQIDERNTVIKILRCHQQRPDSSWWACASESEYPDFMAPQYYAIIIFLSDGLLDYESSGKEKIPVKVAVRNHRFLEIARHIPMELQMILANMTAGSARETIPRPWAERAFRGLAARCTEC